MDRKYLTDYPDLYAQVHPKLNAGLDITSLTHASRQRIWWKCPVADDHVWQTTVLSRTKVKSGCPFCLGSRPSSTNSIASLYPDLAKQWHPTKNGDLTPDQVTKGSKKKVWWKCPIADDHEWQAAIGSRALNGRGCPFCAGVCASSTNSVEALYPDIAKEWHPTKNGDLQPSDVTKASTKQVWWRCSEGHEYQHSVNRRTSRVKICPYCSGYRIGQGNSFADKYPAIAAEFHPTLNGDHKPEQLAPNSKTKIWFICPRGHEYKTGLNNRTAGGTGCPACKTNSTSQQELRLFCEMKYLFPDTKHRHKIRKTEFDVFVPSLNLGIEYDSNHWHRDKQKGERIKNARAEQLGITLIRVREDRLEQLSETDFMIPKKRLLDKPTIDEIFKHIFHKHLIVDIGDRLTKYLRAETFQNESLYLKEFKKYYQDDSDEGILWIQSQFDFSRA